MHDRPSIIERAFQLARSGDHATLDDIRARLRAEKYADAVIYTSGHSIARQLRGLIAATRIARAPLPVLPPAEGAQPSTSKA